jgi:hypothetical protein
MIVVDIDSVRTADNSSEFEGLLRMRIDNSYNAFWISHDGEEYPTLSLLVRDDFSVLHYIPEEFNAGYQSVGNGPGLDALGVTSFSISRNTGDDVQVTNEAIVPFSTALLVANEFFHSIARPNCIEWFEL